MTLRMLLVVPGINSILFCTHALSTPGSTDRDADLAM
jgi:hypothetical protein